MKEATNDKYDAQHTTFLSPTDEMDLVGGSCPAPYHCKRCKFLKEAIYIDPDHRSRTYSAWGCRRPNNPVTIPAREWLQREADRINLLEGRTAKIFSMKEKAPDKCKDFDGPRYALYVNNVKTKGFPKEEEEQ